MKNPIGEVRMPETAWYIPYGGRTITDPLAIGHPLEVSPLSREAIFSAPIRAHYRLGIRFLQHPLPHTASRTLANPLVRTGIRISQTSKHSGATALNRHVSDVVVAHVRSDTVGGFPRSARVTRVRGLCRFRRWCYVCVC